MDEHRIAPRRRPLKGAKISFGNGAVIDCTIRNLSDAGAALDVNSPVGIPERFMLVMEADHRHLRAASCGARTGGSAFISRTDRRQAI